MSVRLLTLNAAGRWIPLALNIGAIPLYSSILGLEAYGLIGLFGVFAAFFGIFDGALSTVVARDLSQISDSRQADSFIRQAERVYIILPGIVLLICIVVAPVLAKTIYADLLSAAGENAHTLILLFAATAARLPISFYSAILIGKDKQLELNKSILFIDISRHGISLLSMLTIYNSASTFFICHLAVFAVGAVILRFVAISKSAESHDNRHNISTKSLLKSATSVGATIASFFAINNIDKILLSDILTARDFGLYMLSMQIVLAIPVIHQPVYFTYFSKLTGLIASGNQPDAKVLFHNASRISASTSGFALGAAVLILPYLFPLWIPNRDAATAMQIIILAGFGQVAHGAFNMVYAIQIAMKLERITLYCNFISAILLAFAIIAMPKEAPVWFYAALFSGAYLALVCIAGPLTLTRSLPGSIARWAIKDTLLPWLVLTMTTIALSYALRNVAYYILFQNLLLGIAAVIVLGLTALAVSGLGSTILSKLQKIILKKN
jgi:O-antigen/teichoic acid export membrane protein